MFSQRVLRFIRNSKVLQRIGLSEYANATSKIPKRHAAGAGTFATMGLWGLIKHKKDTEPVITVQEALIEMADRLFDQGNYKEIYDILSKHRDSRDVEILWRLSRALYNMSKSASDVEAVKMIYEAYDLINTAIEVKEDHWAVQKWMAILLDSKSNYEGMKARIKELYNIKKHMLKAAELNPKDATTLYMIGNWCYQVSNLAWYQRNIASVVFGVPPSSTFEEALTYFLKAEEVDPNFYGQNLLMLGKTYLKLNKKDEAIKYLKKASEYKAGNKDDLKASQEAQKILSTITK